MTGIVMIELPADALPAEEIKSLLSGAFNHVLALSGTQAEMEKTLSDADTVLVLVGDKFAEKLRATPDIERGIAFALTLAQTPVLLLSLDGAKLDAGDLAPEVQMLAYLSGATLRSGEHFRTDLANLAREIAIVLEQSGADFDSLVLSPSIRKSAEGRRRHFPINLFMMSAIFACALTIILLPQSEKKSGPTLPPTTTVTTEDDLYAADLYIGFAGDLSRDTQATGQAMYNGVRLALAEHAPLRVDGQPFTVDLLTQDSACSAGTALTVAQTFTAASDLVGVIGDSCNAACAVTVPVYDAAGLPNLTPACTNPDLAAPTFNRIIPPTSAEALAVADYLYETVGTGAALIYDEQAHALQFAPIFQARYESLGGELSTVYGTDSASIDYDLLLDIVLGNEATAIYYAGRASNAGAIRARLVALGAGDVPFVVSVLGDVETFTAQAGSAADGTLFIPIVPPELPEDFVTRYRAAYGEVPGQYAAYAYDATTLLLDGIEQSAYTDESGVRVDLAALEDAIRAVDTPGITGALRCDALGNCAEAHTAVYVLQGGEFTAP